MFHIFFKKTGATGIGFCTFTNECTTPLQLAEVSGTMTVTNGSDTTTFSVADNVVSVPMLFGERLFGKTRFTIQEIRNQPGQPIITTSLGYMSYGFDFSRGERDIPKCYQLSIGEQFKTRFVVDRYEFNTMVTGERPQVRSSFFEPNSNPWSRITQPLNPLGTGFCNGDLGYPNVIDMKLAFIVEGEIGIGGLSPNCSLLKSIHHL